MDKKLIAIAVAGALAAPAAYAQTALTIGGFLKGGVEQLSYGGSTKARTSQVGVVDDSSRIIFSMSEDLGGGLRAVGQADMRLAIDTGGGAFSGNTFVGLAGNNWGRIVLGRFDLHYQHRASALTTKGSLRADNTSLLGFAGGGGTAIAANTRTPNVVQYNSANWGGFTINAAWSSNTGATDADIGHANRKGNAYNLNPQFSQGPFTVGYSYWSDKPDNPGATTPDQRGDRLYGSWTAGPFTVGLVYDRSELKLSLPPNTKTSKRTAWSLPVSFTMGANEIHAHYTTAGDDKQTTLSDGAKMFAVSWAYNFSRRTSAALTYAQIRNDKDASYNLFTSASLGLGAAPGTILAGEDPRMLGVTLRHAF
jgi:predicted porin